MFYATVGQAITRYEADIGEATLAARESVQAPAAVQYIWRHPRLPLLYAGCSNRGTGAAVEQSWLASFAIEPGSGRLSPRGEPLALRSRPVHITVDQGGDFLLVAYNLPSGISAHRIAGDGTVGAALPQPADLDCGVFAHQVRVLPSGRAVVVATRGNDATATSAADPGALKLFGIADGALSNLASVALGGDYGPRHVDFDPTGRWMLLCGERDNALGLYALGEASIGAGPVFQASTLARPAAPGIRQYASAIEMHPRGDVVYLANRADGLRDGVFSGGDNDIAVFALDRAAGTARAVQHVDSGAIHVRTFSLDPSARMAVAASILPIATAQGSHPAMLATFHVATDGRLTPAHRYDIATGGEKQFWSGFIA